MCKLLALNILSKKSRSHAPLDSSYRIKGPRTRFPLGLLLAMTLCIPLQGRCPGGGDGHGELEGERVRTLVEDLASPFFIIRDRAFNSLRELGGGAVPFLVEGLESENADALIGCLRLLDPLVLDESLNARVMLLASRAESRIVAEATRFLAAHPVRGDAGYLSWSRGLLEGGTGIQRSSYLEAIRRPAPDFQTALILEALPALPAMLRPAAVRALARAERGRASHLLDECQAMIRSGRIEEGLVPHLLDALKDCVTLQSFRSIVDSMTAASPLVHGKAVVALTALRSHLYRLKRYDDLIALYRKLCALFPEDIEFALDLADALVLHGDVPGEAEALLETLRAKLRGRSSTGAVIQGVDVQLGLAFAAFRADRPWKPFLEDLPIDLEETPGDYCAGAKARVLLLRGAMTAAEGVDGRELFLKALADAPYDPDEALIDSLLLGRFSVTGFLWRLSRDSGETRCLEVYSQLTDALRTDPSHCRYYPDAESLPSLEDRARSRLPLWHGSFLRQDLGDPEKCAAVLSEFIEVVHQSTHTGNLDLAARAFFNRAAAEMEQKDHARAADSARSGIKICEDLLSEYTAAQEKEPLRYFEERIDAFRKQKALGLLQLATANTMSRGEPETTAALVDQARALAPELVEVRMARALVLARQGEDAAALKILAAVEEYPDQFYNKACALLLLGRKKEALDYLARHFTEAVRPLGRKTAREWALDDPDLDALSNDPRFLQLVGAKK
jgi:tetratricopeptide (TPR) repeat protein